MSQSSSQRSKRQRSSGRSRSRTSDKTNTTTYSAEFAQKAIDRGVYPADYESDGEVCEPGNLNEMRTVLAANRASLSPSQGFEAEKNFKEFRRGARRATSEGDSMAEVMPFITGEKDKCFFSAGTMPFHRLAKLDPELSAPNPDRYYGTQPHKIHERVRSDLNQYIIPSNATDRPAAPNFFLEGKSASGRPDVATRQAMYDGWVGARGMFHLQNYGMPSPSYDGNAYTMEATYCDGQLKIFSTHPMEAANGETKYYMTQLGAFAMTNAPDTFRQGASAYRNARDWTEQQRKDFIQRANGAAAQHSRASAPICQQDAEVSPSTSPETPPEESCPDLASTTRRSARAKVATLETPPSSVHMRSKS